MKRELIYRTDALAAVGNSELSDDDKMKAMQAVLLVQEADAQPVRCKDCKHVQHDVVFDSYWCKGKEVTAEWYCAGGERKVEHGFD